MKVSHQPTETLLGLRLGEAIALDVADWNPHTQTLRVRRSGPTTDRTKGHREFRDVLVLGILAQAIDAHIAQYCTSPGPLFPGSRGGRLSHSSFRLRYFYPAVDTALGQAALDPENRRRIRPHDLRHLAASLMIQNGVCDIDVAAQLGHVNAAFTRRAYAGVWRREERHVASHMQTWVENNGGL